MEEAQLIIRLKTAQSLKMQDLRIHAMEQVLKKHNSSLYNEYQSLFGTMQEADKDLNEIKEILGSLQKKEDKV